MLYRLLKTLMVITVRLYFRRIAIRNRDRIPNEGPIIFAPNHPGAFLDPIVIAVLVRPQLYFLTRGESFGNPLARTVFGWMNMIPIYSPAEQPKEAGKNDEIFRTCYEHLARKRSILIFPEGTSHLEPRLKKIKTGAARIALGAATHKVNPSEVKIVPVGLNYSASHNFRSELFLNFGEPMSTAEYLAQYKEDEFAGVRAMTDDLKSSIEDLIVVIRNEKHDNLIEKIRVIYTADLRKQADRGNKAPEEDFIIARDIEEAVHHFEKTDPNRVDRFRDRLNTYLYQLQRYGLDDRQLRKKDEFKPRWSGLVFLIFGAPLFLLGTLINYLPWRLTGLITDKAVKRPDFTGAVRLMTGFLCFLIFYTGLLLLGARWLPWWGVVAQAVAMPLVGLFALSWLKRLDWVRSVSALRGIFRKREAEMKRLVSERESLIKSLEEARDEYMAVREEEA